MTRWLTIGFVVSVGVGTALRFWQLGQADLSIDEAYTALAARRSMADLIPHIDATDPHPPLAYLLLQPVAGITQDIGLLRSVSALASTLALVVMAIWQRSRGVAGLVATAVFALSPFQLAYGRQMRMYGLMALAGVVAAYSAERWLESSRRRWLVGAVGAGLVCAFSHAVGVVLLGALLLLPWTRRDRAAWELRAAVIGALAVFASLWGSHTLAWQGRDLGYPRASVEWISIVVNESIAAVPDNRWIVLAIAAIGGFLLLRRRDASSRVWVVLFVLPVVLLVVASLRRGVLIPKAMVPFSWGLPLAIGALCGEVGRRRWPGGVALVVVVALLVVPFAPS